MQNAPSLHAQLARANPPNGSPKPSSETSLTPREREVVQWMSCDQNVKNIALLLNISAFTVQGHIKNIKHKMDVRTSGGIVAKAIREGLIE